MNAADVLDEAHFEWACTGEEGTQPGPKQTAALLAHGEQGQGVTIEADGDLHPKDPPMTTRLPDGTLKALFERDPGRFCLVPVSAEAGDTAQHHEETK